jgi:hypothetical protein
MAGRQTPFEGDLFLDSYGSGPLLIDSARLRGLRYGPVETDRACVAALLETVGRLTTRGLEVAVVFSPMHPEYRTAYPRMARYARQLAEAVTVATKSTHTRVLAFSDHPAFTAEDFFDAYHLQWPAVQRLSALIAGELRAPSGAPLMALPGGRETIRAFDTRVPHGPAPSVTVH